MCSGRSEYWSSEAHRRHAARCLRHDDSQEGLIVPMSIAKRRDGTSVSTKVPDPLASHAVRGPGDDENRGSPHYQHRIERPLPAADERKMTFITQVT